MNLADGSIISTFMPTHNHQDCAKPNPSVLTSKSMTHAAASRPTHLKLEQVLPARVQTLATTLQRSTLNNYRCTVHRFLSYLHKDFPQVRRLSQLCRDPHLLGWFRSLCEQRRPLANKTRQP